MTSERTQMLKAKLADLDEGWSALVMAVRVEEHRCCQPQRLLFPSPGYGVGSGSFTVLTGENPLTGHRR